MNKIHRSFSYLNIILLLVLLMSIILNINHIEVGAATSWKGYAVYRDGVFNTYDYHAAMMVEDTRVNKSKPIIHAVGYFSPVRLDTWSEFMGGKNFVGICKPKNCTINSTLANSFVSKARELNGISYTVLDQIDYHSGTSKVTPSQITDLRCDGVIEYVYEYYGYRVGGSDANWDITKNTSANKTQHSGLRITPKEQCNYWLTKVSTNLP